MADPPNDPPKPVSKPPVSGANPEDAGGIKALSEDLTKGFQMAPGASLLSIDAEGLVERNAEPSMRIDRGAPSAVGLLELPEEEGKLELAERRSAPARVAAPYERGPGFAARGSGGLPRKTVILASGGALLAVALGVLFVVLRHSGHDLSQAATGVPLSVDSVPAGAAIFVDGSETGQKTPATLASWDWLMPHEIQLRLPGRATFQQTIPEGPHPPPLHAILAPVAFLDLQSTPTGAEVRRGDYRVGTTPGHFELMAGDKNSLTLILAGHLTTTLDVTAVPGETLTRTVVLGTSGTLNLDSDPSGVQVEIDGHAAGATPLQVDLEAGRPHQLRLSAPGLTAEERKVTLVSGKMTSLNVLLGDRTDRELRLQIAATERRVRAARTEMHRLENPRQSREFFQTMARTRRQSKLEVEVDALETKAETLQGELDSHRSVLEDLVEKRAMPSTAAPVPPSPP